MRRGFTLVELLVVVAVIAILAGLMLPALIQGYRSGLLTAAQQRLHAVAQAAAASASDRGLEPPGDGNGTRELLRALAAPGPRGVAYYLPAEEDLTSDGHLANPVHDREAAWPRNALHYRRNLNLPPGPRPGQPPVRRGASFDLWGAGLDPDDLWALRAP